MRNAFKLTAAIAVPLLAGAIGSLFTASSLDVWYKDLITSPLNPPGWVFGPVWTTLFILMGVALFLVWKKTESSHRARIPFLVFGIQLILNVLWSVLFFGLRSPGSAFVEILFLWIAIVATITIFARHSKPAALLLLPYILWVTFATYLNYSIYIRN